MLRQIAFIKNEERIIAGREFRPPRRAHVDNQQADIGSSERLVRARNAGAFEFVTRGAKARGVLQSHRDAAEIDGFFQRVTRRPRNGADDGAFVTQQSIQQTRFARVRRPVNHDANAFAQNASTILGGDQIADFREQSLDALREIFSFIRCDSLLRKIDSRIDVRQRNDEVVANFPEAFAQLSLELLSGGAQRQIGIRANEIDHRLGLGQIHFAIEIGAFGELAWLRGARA